jgi:tetratricopeptide (TPR) repeat protein
VQPLRTKAGELFKLKDYLKALNTYEEALNALNQRQSVVLTFKAKVLKKEGAKEEKEGSLPTIEEVESQIKEISQLRSVMLNNMSLCHFKR